MKITRNKLDAIENYRLLKWLDTPKQRVLCVITPDDKTAAAATTELGMPITALNIKKSRKNLGILKPGPHQHNRPAPEALELICQRLPASLLADIIAHIIGTDQDGDSEPVSDYIYRTSKHRFGAPAWTAALDAAKARFDTGYIPATPV